MMTDISFTSVIDRSFSFASRIDECDEKYEVYETLYKEGRLSPDLFVYVRGVYDRRRREATQEADRQRVFYAQVGQNSHTNLAEDILYILGSRAAGTGLSPEKARSLTASILWAVERQLVTAYSYGIPDNPYRLCLDIGVDKRHDIEQQPLYDWEPRPKRSKKTKDSRE